MNVKLIVMLLIWPVMVGTQGFAGLGTSGAEFATPQPDYAITFPADHGPHPEFRIEWWYVTANMQGPDGTDYGLQWTLFRTALAPQEGAGWSAPQLWMGHAGLTTPDAHFVAERLARGGIGQAGVTAEPFEAWIDDWHMTGDFDAPRLAATGPDFAYDVQLQAQGPIVFHGDAGYSVKSAQGQASHYYSQPFYALEGTITLPDGPVAVTGHAWLDREWSSQPLASDQTGWDWFSLSFDAGDKLMGFRLRGASDYTAATWISANGETTALPAGALQVTPNHTSDVAGRRVPTTWQLTLPARDVDVTVRAVNPQAWMATMIPYWEGPVRVSGSHAGVGYLEMTGYDP